MKNLKKWKENSNNRGFSFVLVIVAIGVVSLLIATVLLIAYQNYQMKVTGLKSEDNFYSAEQVLDEIKAGLQTEMSSSVSVAYSYVMEHYTETEDNDAQRNWYFETKYVDNLYQKLCKDAASGEYDLDNLSKYVIQGSPEEVAEGVAVLADDVEKEPGVVVEYKDGSKVELLCEVSASPVAVLAEDGVLAKSEKPLQYSYDKGITLKGLTVKYTNSKGYMSVVSTDLVLGIPELNFTQTVTTPDVLSYAVIADTAMNVGTKTSKNAGGGSTIDGNVYAGAIKADNSGLTVKAKDYLIVKDDIDIKANSSGQYHFIYEGGTLWADNIILNGAAARLECDSYIYDDLTLNGTGSVISVAGSYFGYSNPQDMNKSKKVSENSSAIIVNGKDAVIDFREVNELMLAGNGYVDLGKVVSGANDENGYFQNTKEDTVLMGESIAIKSNQLVYLAPASAIRVDNATIVESGNPVTVKLDEKKAVSDLSVYLENRIALRELGGKTLANLGIGSADCQKYVVQKANANGTMTIYVYMKLNAEQAAKYFDARYGEEFEKYAKIYLPAVGDSSTVIGKEISSIGRVDINGNIANAASRNWPEKETIKNTDMAKEILGYEDMFEALSSKLIPSAVTSEEKELSVFSNLVNEEELKKFVQAGKTKEFVTPVTELRAVLVNGNYTVGKADEKVRLIVATGDVNVAEDFEGLIVCGGELTVTSGASITAVPEETAAVFQCIYDKNKEIVLKDASKKGTALSPMSFFKDGEKYLLNGIASGYVAETLGEQIDLNDYIKYENWKKQ